MVRRLTAAGPDRRSVTAKALDLLGAFEEGGPRLTLTELAAAADLPLPTAHRLVGQLAEWGALKRDENGRYRVGRRIWKIAQGSGREVRASARPALADLFARTGQTCHLAIRDGHQALIIDRLYGTGAATRSTRVGDRLPLHRTAVGKALLAFEEPWLVEAYAARVTDGAGLAAELDRVRRDGWATAVGEGRPGTCAVAVPVLLDGRPVAAVGLVLPSAHRDTLTRHLPLLRDTVARLEPEASRWPHSTAVAAALPLGGTPRLPEGGDPDGMGAPSDPEDPR